MVTQPSSTSDALSLALSPALARVREVGLVLAGTVALTLIGQISIPLPFTPVPISMRTFLAGWSSGVVVTFGYVIGYVLIAAIAGRAASVWSSHSGSTARRVATGVGLMLLASASVYVPGIVWLKIATGASWGAALSMGVVPFIVGDILKSLVATGLLPARGRLH